MLGKLFRKKPLPELEAEAEAMLAAGSYGDAKLAFDRLEERARKEAPELADKAAARAAACCDQIALRRIEHARELADAGHLELSREEVSHALETARSEAVIEEVRAVQRRIEQRDAVEHAEVVELSDEERLALIQGAWEPLQAQELDSYGEPLERALLMLEGDDAKGALLLLETLRDKAPEPSYLWLEIARAKLSLGDTEGGEEALRTFLSRIGPEEGGVARLLAHRELTRMAHARGDRERALSELEAACEALEDDPRPLLDLGAYLRLLERPTEAVEVLELCASLFNEQQIEWPVLNELGLAYAEAGQDDKAFESLETMLDHLAHRGQLDFPPQGAVALAKIHEKRGNLARAADLYRALADGSDAPNHGLYHREAARLLEQLGLADEARRMAERAAGLGH